MPDERRRRFSQQPLTKRRLLLYIIGGIATSICIGLVYFWQHVGYLRHIESIASEGITSKNYAEIAELIKVLPDTNSVFDFRSAPRLVGNSRVRQISRTQDYIAATLFFNEKSSRSEDRTATVTYTLPAPTNFSGTMLFATFRVDKHLIGTGHLRSRIKIELIDWHGKKMHGSVLPISDTGSALALLRITTTEPIPSGSSYLGFDATRITRITIKFILGRHPESISTMPIGGRIYFDDIYAFSNPEILATLFQTVDQRRVTRDSLNVPYQIRKQFWKRQDQHMPFFYGINLPWHHYGWDVGKNPYGSSVHTGWSAREKELTDDFIFLKSKGITIVRVFLFADLRTGLVYKDGRLHKFDDYVWKDIETLIRAAGNAEMRIIPVLFDFHIVDGTGWESKVGEHPELIFSSDKEVFLHTLMRPLLKEMGRWNNRYRNPIWAIELMNEPENMPILIVPGHYAGLYNWFKDLSTIIHQETDLRVTLGSQSLSDAQRWWNGLDIDVWQFHFYEYMQREHEIDPVRAPRSTIPLQGILFCGELEPYQIPNHIQTIQQHGYNGVMLWSWHANDGFSLKTNRRHEFDSFTQYIQESKKTP